MKQKIRIAVLVAVSAFTMISFQNCGSNESATGDVISEINGLDNPALEADEDLPLRVDENEALDFQTSAVALSSIPAVNYMYISGIAENYIHIRFRCPVHEDGTLYRNIKVYFNGRYWHKFTSGCRNAGNTRSVRFRGEYLNSSNKREIRFVTGSRYLSNDNYSRESKRVCFKNNEKISCN